MKHLIAGLTSIVPALGVVPGALLARGEDDKAAVTRVLMDYYSAFSKLEVQAILTYFHEPSLLISPVGVAAMPTYAAMVATYTPLMEGLRARGYARSELSTLRVRQLSATTSLASGIAVRYNADGEELEGLERAGVTYLLQKADSRWKIAATVVHDADKLLRLE